MKKILLGITTLGAVAGVTMLVTGAFFSDTETSSENTFQAGSLDLKIDDDCTYNGEVVDSCTWEETDLDNHLFFNYDDIKPGDYGENTISMKVVDNPAWVCAYVQNLSNHDNGLTEPETEVDATDGAGNGELQDHLLFTIWRDTDCENDLDDGEQVLLTDVTVDNNNGYWPLFSPQVGGGQPLPGNTKVCLGAAWKVPAETGNIIQTDSVSGDISFYAEQYRHNSDFICPAPPPTITAGYSGLTAGAGVRYKGYNTGGEFYLGTNLGAGYPARVEANYNDFQTVGQKTYQVSFSHSAGDNSIAASITSPDSNLVYDFDTDAPPLCPVANWNTMDVLIRDSKTDSGAELQNLMLNSFALGNVGTIDKAGTPGFQNWTISGFDFSQDFTITADLVVDGYTGNESIKTEFTVGCLP